MNYDNSWYPTWSTGENNSFNKVNDMNPAHGHEMRDLNVSEMQVWDPSDSWIQHDVYKAGHETDSLNSGGEYSSDSTPAWASNPVDWDHDSATRLAQKLLQVQMETTGTESMDPFSTMEEAGNKDVSSFSPLNVQQPGKTGQFVSPTSTAGGNPRFKTEFCRNFREKGDCVYGNQCQFAHGKAELRHDTIRNSKYKTKLCQKYWIHGWCAYGTRCNFIHQEDENQTIKSRQPISGNNSASSNLTGFRPLVANSGLRALRKSSESSGDSGIESGYYKNVTEMASFKKPEVPVEFGGNKMAESSFNGNNGWASIKGTGDMNGCGKDLFNIDVSSELNRNFYLDVVRMKESREVPHPEDNPIPTPMVNFPRNQQITSQYRMMKEAGNMWAY